MYIDQNLKDFYSQNQSLLQSQSIHSCEELVEALGDRYIHEKRDSLMKVLPKKAQTFLRRYYLKNFKAGVDRCPACLLVIVEYRKGISGPPEGKGYFCGYEVKYDRISREVTCKMRSNDHVKANITTRFDERFEDDFFAMAERNYRDDHYNRIGKKEVQYGADWDFVTVTCVFADNMIRYSGRNMLEDDDYPFLTYKTLYEETRSAMHKWLDSIRF